MVGLIYERGDHLLQVSDRLCVMTRAFGIGGEDRGIFRDPAGTETGRVAIRGSGHRASGGTPLLVASRTPASGAGFSIVRRFQSGSAVGQATIDAHGYNARRDQHTTPSATWVRMISSVQTPSSPRFCVE